MQRQGYTRAGMAISLVAAAALGYIAYLQYSLAQADALIATTIAEAHKAAKTVAKQSVDGNNSVAFSKNDELEKKGWVLSENKQSYEYKTNGKVHASMQLDHTSGKVVYKIDCGSFKEEAAQQECSDVLDGTGKNYVNTDEVPW